GKMAAEQVSVSELKLKFEEECAHHHCHDIVKKVEVCEESIKGKEGKNCLFQHARLWECVDHCASPKVFALLK
uniref:UQCRH n=1 Tax=Euglena gracilis TaxID=3039 RepID=UPI002FE4FB3E